MNPQQTLTAVPDDDSPIATASTLPGLVLIWSRHEPQRVGEVILVPSGGGRQWRIGRGEPAEQRSFLELYRQRPGKLEPTGLIGSPRISRTQLQLRKLPSGRLHIENVGRLPMLVRGQELLQTELLPGEVIELRQELLFLVVSRPSVLPPLDFGTSLTEHAFGGPDAVGLVGESPSTWALRRQVAFVAGRQAHVLVQGESGTGKELVANAIHSLSSRRDRPLVARNAATFPDTLIDAELFGNARNFPNPGMVERPGLIGQADGSTLFLDEIGELPSSLQAHLLRVLDQGEYQRLGEATMRRSDLRFVGATNRPESSLKHDVLARLKLSVHVPGLNARREDIPLLSRHLLRRIASTDPGIAGRFPAGPDGVIAISCAFMERLVTHSYTTNVRELETLLWRAMSESQGAVLELPRSMSLEPPPPSPSVHSLSGLVARRTVPPQSVNEAPNSAEVPAGQPVSVRRRKDLTPEVIQACLDKHNGVQDHVWPELGLPNRFALYRLVRKYGLSVRRDAEGESEDPGDGP